METIRREEGNSNDRTVGIVERVRRLEGELKLADAKKITLEEKKPMPWKGKFKSVFKKNPKKLKDKVMVMCFNSKMEIEEPVILPIISGGIVVYKDKGFKFDPAALYTIKIGNKINRVLVLEEDDRIPIGSRYKQVKASDIEELKKQGRYTFNDSILLKMLWNAQVEKIPKGAPAGMIKWIIIAAVALIVIYMFMK
jgi:hypothetical protein